MMLLEGGLTVFCTSRWEITASAWSHLGGTKKPSGQLHPSPLYKEAWNIYTIREGVAMKRLTIVVPYRARESHLEKFVPALRAYFARDKLDRE